MLYIYKDLCYYKICYVLAVWPLAIESLSVCFFFLLRFYLFISFSLGRDGTMLFHAFISFDWNP